MKPIIVDMKDMSDSTEVYDSRPNPFMIYVIYVIVAILFIAFLWMYFSKIDILVKGNGVFRGNDDIYDVSSSITGEIESCNITDGQFVNEGDILLTVSSDTLEETIKVYENELENVNQRIEMLKAYERSLDGDDSSLNALADNKYYEEFSNKKQLLIASISSSDQNTDGQKMQYQSNIDSINTSIGQYEQQLSKLRQAKTCISSRENTFSAADSYYDSLVKSYISDYNVMSLQYDNQIKEYQGKAENIRSQIEKLNSEMSVQNTESAVQAAYADSEGNDEDSESNDASSENVETETQNNKSANTAAKEELEKELASVNSYIQTAENEKQKSLQNLELQHLSSIEQQIESINSSIMSLKTNLTNAKIQMEAVSGKDKETADSISILTEKGNVANELLTYNSKKREYENNINSYDIQTGKCNIIANASGYVQLEHQFKQGAFIQEGATVCQIYPQSVEDYYAEIYVENSDIAKLEEGQKVKFEIAAFPSSEYGYFTGTVESISKDIRVDQASGSAYYLVKAACDETTVQNKDGKTCSIMNGMACQAKVVIDEENVLRYVLQKLDLIG